MCPSVKVNTKKDASELALGRSGNTIRVVSARTGLPMETLRAWERRFDFPRPERRVDSNRRLYSSSDIERLIAIRQAISRGYRIGDVIEKTVSELRSLAPNLEGEPMTGPASSPVTTLAFLMDLLANDKVAELEASIRRVALEVGPRRFVTEIAHPFAVNVGQAWAEGKLSVRHEHLATECLETQLRHMLAVYQDIESRPVVLLATLPGEAHTLPLLLVALYLTVSGARPRLLGGPTPIEDIVETAEVLDADVVGVTVTGAADPKALRAGIVTLRKKLVRGVDVWIGGAGAPALRLRDPRVRVVTSWDEIDQAALHWQSRAHSVAARSS